MPRSIAFIVFPGFQLLDVSGPATAFEIADRFRPGSYALGLSAPAGPAVVSSAGFPMQAGPLPADGIDTVVLSGGDIARSMGDAMGIVAWLKRVEARRIASVCSGAFLLAEAGLLDGRRATTHWASSDHFARRYPKVLLDAECIYVRDGDIWTSAGISAGIDLALALIEEDLGADIARRTAQQLVVYHRRPGGQSQFSALLELGGQSGRFSGLVDWMRANLDADLAVERLAERAAMSPRNFARAFRAETGTTPAKAVERLRLEAAKAAIEGGQAAFDQLAVEVGFGDAGRMRRAFLRGLGQPPQALRRSARRAPAAAPRRKEKRRALADAAD